MKIWVELNVYDGEDVVSVYRASPDGHGFQRYTAEPWDGKTKWTDLNVVDYSAAYIAKLPSVEV